ncbi:unnamed protein product [Linum tenue]|nr:unnamed protein product [Linum tenue]
MESRSTANSSQH